MTKGRRIVLIVVIVVLVVLIAGLAFAGNFFFDYALKSRRGERAPGVTQSAEVVGTSEDTEQVRESSTWLAETNEDVYIQSHDGLNLHAHLSRNDGHRYAVIIHGYTGNGRSMAGFGEKFYDRGYSVLMPDCRGHGESDGNYIGMGWPDRLDVVAWVDHLIAEDPQAEIFLFGISMGGATVMMTSGEPLPPNVKLIIEDCGYTSVWDEFSAQLHDQFGLPTFPIMQVSSLVTKIRAGYWLGEADAVKQVAKSTVPMLFIHGEDDTFVPFWMLEPLYEAKPGIKEKLVVPGAGHGMASGVDPELYWETIDAFLEAHMP